MTHGTHEKETGKAANTTATTATPETLRQQHGNNYRCYYHCCCKC